MISILTKPYDLLKRKAFRYLFVFGGGLFGLFFLLVFEPYGLHVLDTGKRIWVSALYVGVSTTLSFIQFFVLQKYILKRYTVVYTILWIMLHFVIAGTSSSIINAILFNDGYFHLKAFFYFQWIVLSINIIPVTVFVLVHYTYTLKMRLKMATSGNAILSEKADNHMESNSKVVVLNSENKKEGMSLTLDSLISLRSVDNYIELSYLENGTLNKCLLRYSLSRVEQDNSDIDEVFRCHKGYIINKTKIESVTGNAAGYKLKLKDLDELIPVSRKLNGEIKTMAFL